MKPFQPMASSNPSCQHHHVDDDWRCRDCQEKMITQTVEAETVLSAPNVAPNSCPPDCDGEAGCTAVYIPGRAQEVVIGYTVTYECGRCRNDGPVLTQNSPVEWECGHSHRGDMEAPT